MTIQSNNMKWFAYLLVLSFISIISYSFVTSGYYNSASYSGRSSKEIFVYREQDVLKLLSIVKKMSAGNDSTAEAFNKIKPLIQEEKKLSHDYLKKYPNFMNCHKETLKKWTANTVNPNPAPDYSKPAPQETHGIDFTRAVLLYFPLEQADHFKLEFKWFYRSWIEMQKHEPKKWRTDLVIFIENDAASFNGPLSFLNELNCNFINRRTSSSDKPMCILVHYVALKKRKVPKPKQDISIKARYENLLANVDVFNDDPVNLEPFYSASKDGLSQYGYVDSILMAFDGYQYFKTAGYDFLIRSDMDVFLTPLFAKWLPDNCNDFYVGRGGYSDDFNRKRLSRIAKDLQLEHAGESNLGSTWYSTPEQFRLVSYLTIFSMTYLSQEEFSQPEREGKVGVQLWPFWHYGVLLLYGQNIGLNHLIGSKQLNVVKLDNLIDFPSANDEDINRKIHIHVFHGDNMFSKFAFKVGKYDNMNVKDSEVNKVKNYCLKMALDAKRSSNAELKSQLDAQIASKI